jgi:hypothetical protein
MTVTSTARMKEKVQQFFDTMKTFHERLRALNPKNTKEHQPALNAFQEHPLRK